MTHDPLCPTIGYSFEFYTLKTCPFCPLIAKVREDERHKSEMHDYHQPAWMAGHRAALDPDTNARMHAMTREDAIRDAAGEAALALLAMDGVEFTPEQHNSVVDAILALQEKP